VRGRPTVGDRLLFSAVSALGPYLLRALGRTWRVRVLGEDRLSAARKDAGPLVFAFWHRTLLPLAYLNRGRGICLLSSLHRDGELSARVMAGLGYSVVRGSTSRGSARGLQLLVQKAREGVDVAVTPDGPRGPALVAQPGVLYVARRAGAPVVPVGAAASRALTLSSWDRSIVPLPFCTVVVANGEPLTVPVDGPLEDTRRLLDERLAAATEEARRAALGTRLDRPRQLPVAYRAYRAATLVIGAAATPWLRARAARRAEWRERLGEHPATGARPVWVHAASVGEVAAAAPIVRALRARGLAVFLTAVTRTGRQAAGGLAEAGVGVAFAPLDLVPCVRRTLAALRPSALLLVETELWPNLVAEAARAGVPVGVVNGRLSGKRGRRYGAVWSPVRVAGMSLSFAACQSERDARRFAGLGVPPGSVVIAGNTKFDTSDAPLSGVERAEVRRSLGIAAGAPVAAFGSVRPREEEDVVSAVAALAREHPRAWFVVAPRHLDRASGIAASLEAAGVPAALRSAPDDRGDRRAIVLDTTGELSRVYGIASVAFVGGTLAPYGGHNPLEPAARGVPVVIGPHTGSCRDSADALVRAGGAIRVEGEDELRRAVGRFLTDGQAARAASAAALAVVAGGRGATARTLALLERVGVVPEPGRGEEAT